jgi:hypothetical protein
MAKKHKSAFASDDGPTVSEKLKQDVKEFEIDLIGDDVPKAPVEKAAPKKARPSVLSKHIPHRYKKFL